MLTLDSSSIKLFFSGSHLQHKIQFAWVNQEDVIEVDPRIV